MTDLAAFYAGLPRKRVGAGVVYRDASNRVLMVEPTYKPDWEVPGGIVEEGESPRAAAVREVREELGSDLPVGRLLAVDWVCAAPPRTEGLFFLFDGGVLDDRTADSITLPAPELRSWRWCAPDEVTGLAVQRLARRLLTVLTWEGPAAVYLENGALSTSLEEQA